MALTYLIPVAQETALHDGVLVLLMVLFVVATGTAAFIAIPHGHGRPRGRHAPLSSPARQVEVVSSVRFEVTPILSPEEAGLFATIEAAVSALAPGCRVLARVSLDEVVRALADAGEDWDGAMASIRTKRLDFAIFDPGGRIIAGLGCAERARRMGAGRDQVRRAALARAGIPYVVLGPDMTVEAICLALAEALPRNIPA